MARSPSLAGDGGAEKDRCVRVLCPVKISAFCYEPGLYWLIGSPRFLSQFTIISALRCLHYLPEDPYSPDCSKEADDIRTLLLRGFNVVGALAVRNTNWEENARKAVDVSQKIREILKYDEAEYDIMGAAADSSSSDIHFFASKPKSPPVLEALRTVLYDGDPEKYLWENGCLLRCQLEFKLSVYVPVNGAPDVEIFSSATDAAVRKLRDPQVVYLVEGTESVHQSMVLRGSELNSNTDISGHKTHVDTASTSGRNDSPCSYFFSNSKRSLTFSARENADTIRVRIFFSHSVTATNLCAPSAEYIPAPTPVRLMVADFKVDVLCYASKDSTVSSALSSLVIPGLVDQLITLRKCIGPKLLSQQPQLCPCHFFPAGILHPITAIYDLNYGETEKAQVEIRKSLHLRLGLPLDRPLLLIANALDFNSTNVGESSLVSTGAVIKDVHTDISRSGVSGGLISMVDGSYEYYHYLQDGFDDNGWGCAYRSLQTIISWFRLQHYTSVQVPSHRKIQQALVEIGDKELYFVGSREWIGAIELSFVLDKLLGVSCKIINVRSGAELPEKCRELSLHFENQGTPVMIGGGVLAYTLLGVDYNEVTGDCAFLILDPHYTGGDDRKKIMNGGWCGWKKAVDSKGKNFFLHDKFYNLLLPQRPNMV